MSTPPDVAALAAAAGLTLTEAQLGEFASAYEHLRGMIARMPYPRSYADEPAHVFLPLPYSEGAK
jgi:hypothetical protein